jgi:hypothetical protein
VRSPTWARRDAVLERADHLETGAIADVGETRVAVAAEVALQDAAVGGAVEAGAPRLELAHAVGSLAREELRHAPVVEQLAAAHGVAEVHLPAVARVRGGEGRRHPALGHDRVRLPEQRLAHETDRRARERGLDRRPEPRAAGPYHEHVVDVALEAVHVRRAGGP